MTTVKAIVNNRKGKFARLYDAMAKLRHCDAYLVSADGSQVRIGDSPFRCKSCEVTGTVLVIANPVRLRRLLTLGLVEVI